MLVRDAAARGRRDDEGKLAIDECVENVVAVLLHQVVDVTEDTAVEGLVSLCLCWRVPAADGGAARLTTWRGNEWTIGWGVKESDCMGVRFNSIRGVEKSRARGRGQIVGEEQKAVDGVGSFISSWAKHAPTTHLSTCPLS